MRTSENATTIIETVEVTSITFNLGATLTANATFKRTYSADNITLKTEQFNVNIPGAIITALPSFASGYAELKAAAYKEFYVLLACQAAAALAAKAAEADRKARELAAAQATIDAAKATIAAATETLDNTI